MALQCMAFGYLGLLSGLGLSRDCCKSLQFPISAGELSSLPQEPLQGVGQQMQSREGLAYPSGSLISTAMRPSAHAARQPRSPPPERATSVVSKTALRRSPEAVRAGTPASVYAQDRAPQRRPLNASPHDSQAIEQVKSTLLTIVGCTCVIGGKVCMCDMSTAATSKLY